MTAAPPSDAAGVIPVGLAGGGNTDSAYCDAGPIVAAVMGPADPFFDAAMRFFKEAEIGGVRLIISSLALSEAVDVIRKRTKAGHRCADEGGGEREAVDADAAAAVKRLARFIYNLKADKRADILEEKVSGSMDFAHLYEMMLRYQGRTPQARKGDTYRHEGIGPIDWIHMALARLAGARAICTTDKAMAQIAGDKIYGGIEVVVLRPR